MKKKLIGAVGVALGMIMLFTGCPESSRSYLEPGDLAGAWDATTLKGSTTLVFKTGGNPTFEIEAPLFDDEPLIRGYWYLAGSIVTFEDFGGTLACFEIDDRYEVTMLDDGFTIMELTHLSEDCTERAEILEDVIWMKREADEGE